MITGIVSSLSMPHWSNLTLKYVVKWAINQLLHDYLSARTNGFSSLFSAVENDNSQHKPCNLEFCTPQLQCILEKCSKLESFTLIFPMLRHFTTYKDKRTHKVTQRISLYNPGYTPNMVYKTWWNYFYWFIVYVMKITGKRYHCGLLLPFLHVRRVNSHDKY